ncbi:MAG: TldD/PmbA family protein [Bacteroidales bacterium]|nr:TldD/PmbA family protein [Bacteroidales bacterium]
MLTDKEIALARASMEFALENGAQKVRVTLNKSLMELFGMLNGELDKVTHALDRSLQVSLFVDGRFGSFSSNRLEEEGLKAFLLGAIDTVRTLEPDAARDLPDPARTVKDALNGKELNLYDSAYEGLTSEQRREMAVGTSLWSRKAELEKGFTLISEEGEYSDSLFDSVVMDSNGLFARHTETSFEIGYEVTVEDPEGNRYASYWWDASPRLEAILPALGNCSETAVRRAAAQIGPQDHPGGKCNIVVDSECASKFLTPVLSALGGYAVQQKNSFLLDKVGERVFPEYLTILDCPRNQGESGARLYDSEGVATKEFPIIDKGVITRYFVNTYIAGKTGMEPTIEDATRPKVVPFGGCKTREDLLCKVGNGILINGFNGGNSNPSTGNFSYGIEGFAFENGQITHPVREMLVTGNFIDLWNNLIATADDARLCMSKIIPTLAFQNIDCNA